MRNIGLHTKKCTCLEVMCITCIIAGAGAASIFTNSERICFDQRLESGIFCANSRADQPHLPDDEDHSPPSRRIIASSTASAASNGHGVHVLHATNLTVGSPVLGMPELRKNTEKILQ
ncbi:MAG: hypothetical protein ACM3IH_18860 [Sphingobacteriales bacterium]|jgi:hypothetical protein